MMKRKMTSVFAVAAVMGVATAFAVNPFSDVPSDSWAYQAVDQLAIAGIINGYPDGTFKGQNALAVGYSRSSDNGKVIFKLQGNANTQGDVGGSVGIGYQW